MRTKIIHGDFEIELTSEGVEVSRIYYDHFQNRKKDHLLRAWINK